MPRPLPMPYIELPAADFRADNCSRTLGYSWADVQDLSTLQLRAGVRVLGISRAADLPFTPPGEWIAIMAEVPEYGPMWFHQSETVVCYMAEMSAPASRGIDRPAAFLVG